MAGNLNPLASRTEDIAFSRLHADEIKRISVKRIHVTPALDTLLNPVPGGLYDPALGSLKDFDFICTTCRLPRGHCTGHCGHIELPVDCYHPQYLSTGLRLLRAKCQYCHRLRLAAPRINLIACQLELLQHGLSDEAEALSRSHVTRRKRKRDAGQQSSQGASVVSETESDEDADDLVERQNRYVRKSIRRTKKRNGSDAIPLINNPTAVETRQTIIKSFLLETSAQKKCFRCQGYTPSYRTDRNLKIFKMVLSKTQAMAAKQMGLKAVNPLLFRMEELKARQPEKKRLTNGWHYDDDQAMDMDEPVVERHGAEDEIALQNALETAAEAKNTDLEDEEQTQQYMTPTEVRAALDLLFDRESRIMNLLFGPQVPSSRKSVTPDIFFMTHILVPPNKYRPAAKQGESVVESPQNSVLSRVIAAANEVNQIAMELRRSYGELATRNRTHLDHAQAGIALQEAVNTLIDQVPNPNAGRANLEGIKQKLEKKEGLFRQNMMGKRVNFAARSVISPDPNIETNEIGVPLVFAQKLTYPEPVTSHNFEAMSRAVINGSDSYPGAAAIENEKGQVLSLKYKDADQRRALAKQLLTPTVPGLKGVRSKTVHRHLQTGDVVIMNRQPTLHKPSMMAHRARVLMHEKTIRMHYANCNTYNADFDGDEMNMHFPQNEVARAESFEIADTDHQYLSATAGKPLRGLIQDHLSMGVQFTSRDVFFDKDEYHQLLYSCLRPEDRHTVGGRIQTLPPALLKPKCLWTGKQIVSTLLKNIRPASDEYRGLTLTSRSSTSADQWGEIMVKNPSMFMVTQTTSHFRDTEQTVIFRDGEHLSGILDKAQLGPSVGGLVHSIYELYGHITAGKFLSILGRLLTRFLSERAWSCGMDDLFLTTKGDEERRDELNKAAALGHEVAAGHVSLSPGAEQDREPELLTRLEAVLRSDEQQIGLDQIYNANTKSITESVTRACLPAGLRKSFPKNQMQAMTISGAKGSNVNANLISCNLGQQVLEGRRVPVMVSGKTLPSFRKFETDPLAGGYVSGRFLTGIRPQEYFFHSMSGREGLIDTAVKTAKSGYLQRCIVKGLEGFKTEYDSSVREVANGTMVQFLYGEDGLDVAKQKQLRDFSFIATNSLSVAAGLRIQELLPKLRKADIDKKQKETIKSVRRGKLMDPVLAAYSPSTYLGSTSESFASAVAEYVKTNPDRLIRDRDNGIHEGMTKKSFQRLLNVKYLQSVVEPGEAVGVVAAQSVGEPSTQMTLNTFHLAGHSAKNVTLGIPRLREIIMTASADIALPTMSAKLIPELSVEDGERFAKSISRLSLAEVIENLIVTERTGHAEKSAEKYFEITIDFYPPSEYQQEYNIRIEDVSKALEQRFVPRLEAVFKTEMRKKAEESSLTATTASVPEIGASVGRIEEARPERQDADREGGEDDADDDFDPEDAKQTSTKERQNETFDEPDEDEVHLAEESNEGSGDEEVNDKKPTNAKRKSPQNLREDNPDESDTEMNSGDEAHLTALQASNPHLKKLSFMRSGGRQAHIVLAYPENAPKMLLLPIVEAAVQWSVIQSLPNVKNCALFRETVRHPTTDMPVMTVNPETHKEEELKESVITCEGVSLRAIRDYQDIINPHTIYTNSVHHMLTFYGVEAARMTIVKEIDAVFKGHGISVDNRHINLIADAMTQSGGYRAFSRNGLVKDSGSVLGKMSFETVMGFLREAVLFGERDPLSAPSARLVAGLRGQMGTGSFDVVIPVS